MRMSPLGALALMCREAVVLSTYLDAKGVPTIFVGHTANAGEPLPTPGRVGTLEEAMRTFQNDLEPYERAVSAVVTVPIEQHEFDALVSFHFNSGGIEEAKLTELLNQGDKAGAAAAFMNWLKPASIRARRESEKRQFETGDYGNTSSVLVYDRYPGPARRVSTAGLLSGQPIEVDSDHAPFRVTVDIIRNVQQMLRDRGYPEVGRVDGKMGTRTRGSILAFQADNNLPLTGTIEARLISDLIKAAPRRNSPERESATAADLKDSKSVQQGSLLKKVGAGLVAASGLGGLANGTLGMSDLITSVSGIKTLTDTLLSISPWIIGGAIGAAAIWFGTSIVREQVKAYREGRHV